MKKKIAFIHGSLVTGGAEKALINLLRFLDYDQYEVTLWLKDDQGEMYPQVDPRVKIRFWKEYLDQDYKQIVLRLIEQGRLFSLAYSVFCRALSKLFLKNWYSNYKYYIKSLTLAERTNYDAAVNFQLLGKDECLVLSHAIRAKKKIGWIHGKCSHNLANPLNKIYLKEYPKLNHIFCVSKDCRDLFIAKYPALTGKTSVMYNLQDFDTIRSLADEAVEESFDRLTFVTVGRLSGEKGQDMIPAISEKLLERGHKFVWLVIGDGPTREKIEREIEERGLSKTVHLLGQKTNPYPYIKNCSLYVQPSYTEGFCVTTFEAKILQTPVVVTDVSGMGEQFFRDEAVFCKPDVESLTEGIERAIRENKTNKRVDYVIPTDFNQRELKKLYAVIEG